MLKTAKAWWCTARVAHSVTRVSLRTRFSSALRSPMPFGTVTGPMTQITQAAGGSRAMSGSQGAGGMAPPNSQQKVFEVNEGNFMQVVMETSDVVILDCAASWCQPCKELTPKLVAAVQKTEGMRLAVMDVDECQQIASQLQIESVPTVFGVFKGKVINKLTGSQTDEAVQEFVAGLAKLNQRAGAQDLLKMGGEALAAGQVQEALRAYGEVLAVDKAGFGALALSGMALCALALKDLDGAKQLVAAIEKDYKTQLEEPIVKQAITAVAALPAMSAVHALTLLQVEVATESMEVDDGELASLRKAVESDANDHDSRRRLAVALFGRQEYETAMGHALEIVKRDKAWDEDGGRKLLFKFFDTLGSQHPDVQAARRRLALLLF